MLVHTQDRNQRILVFSLAGGLAALAWLAFFTLPVFQMSGEGAHAQLHTLVAAFEPGVLFRSLGLFLTSWVVMTAAMMLPTTLPMIDAFSRLTGPRPDATSRVPLFILGYLVAWTGFGLAAFLVDIPVHLAVHQSAFLAEHSAVIGAGLLCLAGIYQFTPLKRRCLSQCRSAFSFLMNNWREGKAGALRMGLHHGAFCVGCCWALMLLMFGLGMAHLGWMLALTLLMFVEKVAYRGERVGFAAGLGFLLIGAATLVLTLMPALF